MTYRRFALAWIATAMFLSTALPAPGTSHGTEPGELSPRYEPVPPQPKSSYNSAYLFGMTRGVAQSTVHSAVKVPLFVITVPLDIVFLPFAAIGGFFG
jgi:hypothetical protein